MSVVHWFFRNLISIGAVIIAFLAYQQSKSANKLADDANQLAKSNIIYSKEKDKKIEAGHITDRIIDNWSKSGGPRAAILSEWQIYNSRGFTIEEFNMIWKNSFLRKKNQSPDKSFQDILNECNSS